MNMQPSDAIRPTGMIAVMSHAHPSLSKGGSEMAAHALFRGLRALGQPVMFLSAHRPGDEMLLSLGPDEYSLPVDPQFHDPFHHLALPADSQAVIDLLRAKNVTIVAAHHFLNWGQSVLRDLADAGFPVVLTLHDFNAICHHHGQMVTRPDRTLCHGATRQACTRCFPDRRPDQFDHRKALFADMLGRMRHLISPSRFLQDRFAEWGLPRDRISIIENAVAHPQTPVPAGERRAGPVRIGYFGQITPFKGVDVIMSAVRLLSSGAESLPPVQFRVHGNLVGQADSFVADLRSLADSSPLFAYLGPYDNSDVHDLMSDCDWIVVPSRWWENSPVVIQEALSARRPLLVSGIGGMAEKVRDGLDGHHFTVGSAADLAARVRGIIADHLGGRPWPRPDRPVLDPAGMAAFYLPILHQAAALPAAPA